MHDSDILARFLFERAGIRGNLVHLDASWRAIQQIHPYPAPVAVRLGEALAAVSLLAATIKFKGSLILQVQGSGPIRTLVAQATHAHTIRGLARWEGEVPADSTLLAQFGGGELVLTVDQGRGQPYQGVVPLMGVSFSESLEHYFEHSEQIPTRLWLAADTERAAGLLLQRLPDGGSSDEDWQRLGLLSATVTSEELIALPVKALLHRLFHEEEVRLFDPEPIAFRCNCSRSRIADMIRLLDETEVKSVLAEQGAIEVTCEFCNRRYRFDAVDVHQILAATTHHEPPPSHQ